MLGVWFRWGTSAALGFGLAASACYPRAELPQAPAPGLRDVEIPAGFDFAASRAVSLTVRAPAEVTGSQSAALEVTRPDGKILFRGPVHGDRLLSIDVHVPTKDEALTVKLMARGRESVASVMIIHDEATASF